MNAIPLTDSLTDIAERKERMLELLKQLGLTGVYACAVLALSTAAFLGSHYYLSQLTPALTGTQSIATNFANE